MPVSPTTFSFRPRHRLSLSRDYQAVFAARARKSAGPLTVFAKPTDRPEPRLGLSVGRKVGRAHDRVAIKRHLREAFRHIQHELPTWEAAGGDGDGGSGGKAQTGRYDYIIQVRPHQPLAAEAYQSLLLDLARGCHVVWAKRLARGEKP